MTNFEPMPKRFMVWDGDRFLKLQVAYPELKFQTERMKKEKVYDLDDIANLSRVADISGFELIQSTNLFDKDDKEIFEGSIVRDNFYIFEGRPLVAVVVPHEEIAAFTLSKSVARPSNVLLSVGPRYEVIGHVLSDPELLEEKA